MYEKYYKLKEAPFTLLPNPKFMYLSKKHAMGLATLEYALLNNAGFSLLTGDIGSGKTTLIRALLDKIEDDYVVGLVSNTHRSFGNLMQWVSAALGLDYTSQDQIGLYDNFVNFIIKSYSENRKVLLIVDEAQNLDAAILEELRVLSNINADEDQLLQVILVGQPELRNTLRKTTLKQFAQRILADYHLEPLSKDEVQEYITHRLQVALADLTIFESDAMELIAESSQGIPRIINLLCDTALVYGFASGEKHINKEIVFDVLRDKQKSGLLINTDQDLGDIKNNLECTSLADVCESVVSECT